MGPTFLVLFLVPVVISLETLSYSVLELIVITYVLATALDTISLAWKRLKPIAKSVLR